MGNAHDTVAPAANTASPRPTTMLGWIWDAMKGIGMLIALAVVLVGVAWWEGWFSIGGIRGPGSTGKGLANGEVCKRDRDCASGFCERRQDRCEAKLRTGDACDRDVECASDNCALATTRASRKSCR